MPEKTEKLDLPTQEFIRKPFTVEATMVTHDNIAEVASVTGRLEYKDDGTPFIVVDKQKMDKVWRIFPGFYLTHLNGRYRAYSPKAFAKEFLPSTPELSEWVESIKDV